MTPEALRRSLCSNFCSGVSVNPVASGYAVSSVFEDNSGDRISFYITPTSDGFVIEDDGAYLAHLIAKDIRIDHGTRGQLLDAILSTAGAYWDKSTYEMRTPTFPESELSKRALAFLSSLIRVRDLELLTRENVRSTFREDAIRAIQRSMGHAAEFEEDSPVSNDMKEFPADLVVHPRDAEAKTGAIYFVNTTEKLNEALLLRMEADRNSRRDFEVVALVEEPEMRLINRKKFQRAQNRDLVMPIFREDEDAATNLIRLRLRIPLGIAA